MRHEEPGPDVFQQRFASTRACGQWLQHSEPRVMMLVWRDRLYQLTVGALVCVDEQELEVALQTGSDELAPDRVKELREPAASFVFVAPNLQQHELALPTALRGRLPAPLQGHLHIAVLLA